MKARLRHRRLWLVALAAAATVATVPLATASSTVAAVPAATASSTAPAGGNVQLARIGGARFGGGRGFFASRPSVGRGSRLGRSTRSRGILRSIGRALAFAAIFHFLFGGTSGFGFVLLLLVIAGLFALRRRRRQRVYARW